MKSLLSIQNERRLSERRQEAYERRGIQDRRTAYAPVAEERRQMERRVLEERRIKERRMDDFQKNIMRKDVLEPEEHALITSRGLDE